MSLDDAIDALDGAGTAVAPTAHGEAQVDVVEADRLGVRVRGVEVHRGERDIREETERLSGLRALPERVEPSEVAPELGGAILRTVPDEVHDGFYEVEVRGSSTRVKRVALKDGERRDSDFVLTREQLRRLVDELD